jgi:hypothetical protein
MEDMEDGQLDEESTSMRKCVRHNDGLKTHLLSTRAMTQQKKGQKEMPRVFLVLGDSLLPRAGLQQLRAYPHKCHHDTWFMPPRRLAYSAPIFPSFTSVCNAPKATRLFTQSPIKRASWVCPRAYKKGHPWEKYSANFRSQM